MLCKSARACTMVTPSLSRPIALQECSAILLECVREADIVARMGGDEFAVILPETDSGQAAVIAERLRKVIRARCGAGMRERLAGAPGAHPLDDLDITVSVGVSSCPEHPSDVDGLIKAADDAMYAVKNASKNGVAVSALPTGKAPDRGNPIHR